MELYSMHITHGIELFTVCFYMYIHNDDVQCLALIDEWMNWTALKQKYKNTLPATATATELNKIQIHISEYRWIKTKQITNNKNNLYNS